MNTKFHLIVCLAAVFLSCQKDQVTDLDSFEIKQEILLNDTDSSAPTTLVTPVKNWVLGMQHTSGLLESAAYTNFVSLYDNALAAIYFINENEQERAERVLDFYQSKMQEELVLNGGFYQFRNTNGKGGERIWMGDNAWLLIAINQYKEKYGTAKYDLMANQINLWLRSLQLENGALRGGLNQDGSEIPLVTEGIITAFNAVPGFDDFHIGILNYLQNERWDSDNRVFLAWPENPSYAHALDVYSLSSSIFADIPIDALLQADRFYTQQESTMTGEVISGYCFDEDKDVVWLEGTAQMAVAFKSMGYTEKSDFLIKELEKSFIPSTISENIKGVPYSANHGTSYGTSVLWDHVDINPALSSTIWYLFSKAGFNPLELGKGKQIPEANKFWMQGPSS
jgi:hypothetical protein